jgi:adenosine deaminase
VVPKAELHVHLEGTATPALVRALAARNGVPVPDGLFAGPHAFAWDGFRGFLAAYDRAASVIRTARDYRDVTFDYLSRCAAEGAVYVELIASPDHAAAAGLSDADHEAAIAQGIDDARDAHGIEARVVATALRDLGAERAVALARRLARERHPYVVGFNLSGDEAAHPARHFAAAYAVAHDAGLGCTVHAGEHAGPESVREALALPVTRISHGVRAAEDPALVAQIAARGVVLEVCPTSNVATGVYASYADHPLGALRDAGVRVTLASDDPPYFGASIGGEYAVAAERFGFGDDELLGLTRTAIAAGFADAHVRRELLARLPEPADRASS